MSIRDDLNDERIKILKKCFSELSIRELIDRIDRFRTLVNIRDITEHILREELKKIFTVEYHYENVSFFLKVDIQTLPHQIDHFYRIREFSIDDYKGMHENNFSSMQKRQDAWIRPDCFVKEYGRLNRPGESVLYVSKEVTNAIYEKGCKIGDYFFLLIYESKRSMRISQINNVPYLEGFTEDENAKRRIMHDFLLSEFTKFVIPGREYLYKSSLIIYEDFFSNPNIDGFGYPSIASNYNRGFNLGFTKDKAELNLNFLGVMVCELVQSNANCEFLIKPLLDGFLNQDERFTYFPYNSEASKNKFGRFALVRDCNR